MCDGRGWMGAGCCSISRLGSRRQFRAMHAGGEPPSSILHLLSDICGCMPRKKIILACSDCKNRNYFTTKNKRVHPERVEWKKYCPRCDNHVLHKETK